MSLRHAILGIIDYHPIHAYGLKRVLEEGISTFWPVNLAAIYPSLRKLEVEGLVAHRLEKSADGRPDRKVFEITDAGRDELARWRHLPPEGSPQNKVPLYLKLLFARSENLPDVVQWIDKEIESACAGADSLRAELRNPEAFSTFFVRFMRESGLAHTELQLEMLRDLRARVVAGLEKTSRQEEAASR